MPTGRTVRGKAVRSKSDRHVAVSRAVGSFPVVAIGASAGGLDACRRLLDALPAGHGMAFVFVQHLDPTHKSMLVELLSGHTSMTVRQVTDGMAIEPEHLYAIPPGTYLSVVDGILHLSQPQARHGARLPFDFLLHSLAVDLAERAICVVLSGSGSDGSLGLVAVRDAGGLVVAQDPGEADFDGMPHSAIATGAVDLVLPVARIPAALTGHARGKPPPTTRGGKPPADETSEWLPEIVELLRMKSSHDFTFYKPGTLQRRIQRRLALAADAGNDMHRYIEMLGNDPAELDMLVKDLLIHVTGFFRDPEVFEVLANEVIPDLVRDHPADRPLRIWVVGCSSGEEAYSLAILIFEQIAAAGRNIKLQVFGSDIDPDAIASARDGIYPLTIAADVSPARLERFFTKEDRGYRIVPELRAMVVFTVQDVLADPPFSRLDMVSCRNLLIYLRPEAQARMIAILDFALRKDGTLILGKSESIGTADDGRFEPLSKVDRIFRHAGHGRPGTLAVALSQGVQAPFHPGARSPAVRQSALASLCQRLVLESHAPAAILIDRAHQCLSSVGPTERYLRVAPEQLSNDLLAMARAGLRTALRSAIHRSGEQNIQVVVDGGRMQRDGKTVDYQISVEPVRNEGDDLFLVCFVDKPRPPPRRGQPETPGDAAGVAELERELSATRIELEGAIDSLETANAEQNALADQARSLNEELQTTNEELLTSKEELQSLNEELTALNSQLQETLEQQRTTANDLQNVLTSTNVATLFLDRDLRIRYFTPAVRAIFSIIPGDVGRPLADLRTLAVDETLLADSRAVLSTLAAIECEVEVIGTTWYARRVQPYRTQDGSVGGVVVTFTDITERKRAAAGLEEARREADQANIAKSRFLGAASHDLRQPLQSLSLLHGMLVRKVEGDEPQRLLALFDLTLGAMSGMLNTLLDINEIDSGTVRADYSAFSIGELLARLRDEFGYHAESHGLRLRAVDCSAVVYSDPHLLEQMLLNLLSNAFKYTRKGGVLIGCRRYAGMLSVEVWDTGIGIPDEHLGSIFDEYHQIDNAARERSRGLGLGLSIVRRLGHMLGHKVRVRSRYGEGSVFAIEIGLPPAGIAPQPLSSPGGTDDGMASDVARRGEILIVEDDPHVRELLRALLADHGYHPTVALDGLEALDMAEHGAIQPDLLLTDYNLPNGMTGLQVATGLRAILHRDVPTIIITGDISAGTLRAIASLRCLQLNKPVRSAHLLRAIAGMLPPSRVHAPERQADMDEERSQPVIYVVDDDSHIRDDLRAMLEDDRRIVETYGYGEAFLDAYRPGRPGCLLLDANMPGMSGLELLHRLRTAGHRLPTIIFTGSGDVSVAVAAMKGGAMDYLEKPVGRDELLARIDRALELSKDTARLASWHDEAAARVAGLTPRQRQVMDMVLAGVANKNIAADLGISQRTVENHRATVMDKMEARSLPDLVRLAVAARPAAG